MFVNTTKFAVKGMLALLLLGLAACDLHNDDAESEAHVLQIHDVSALQVEELESTLSILLGREDMPLRGTVELVDDTRLAVNASRTVQREIEKILLDLGNGEQVKPEAPTRDYRIQFWLVTMSTGADQRPLPAGLDELLAPIADEFPGYGFQVQDFIESYHSMGSTTRNIQSGAGSNLTFRRLRVTEDGVHAIASVRGIPVRSDSNNRVVYEVDRNLRPGQALILGRAHGGGMGEEAVYQVLIARMDWAD